MAFLTKKEQSLIRAINSKADLSSADKTQMVQQISYNARLRGDGFRKPVKEFFQAIALHENSKLIIKVK